MVGLELPPDYKRLKASIQVETIARSILHQSAASVGLRVNGLCT